MKPLALLTLAVASLPFATALASPPAGPSASAAPSPPTGPSASAAPWNGRETQLAFLGGVQVFDANGALGREGRATGGNALTPAGIIGMRISYLPRPRWGLELEGATAASTTRDGTATATVTTLGVQGIYYFLDARVRTFAVLGPTLAILAPSDALAIDRDLRPALQAGLGTVVDMGGFWGLRLDTRLRAMQGEGRALAFDPSLTVGLYCRFPPPPPPEERLPSIPDRDGDGLSDDKDKCPAVPGPIRNFGCPPDEDRDGDGILDAKDKCPDEQGPAAMAGCPDSDGDGIPDRKDKCPNAAGLKAVGGCPDGDADGDGIVDRLDKCPAAPETKNGFEDMDGCPDTPPAAKLEAIAQQVAFEPGNDVLTPASRAMLDGVVQMLRDAPGVAVDIVGHTDTTGQRPRNLTLSLQRAEAVRRELLVRGVPAAQVTAAGKGPDEPIADNGTPEGRRKNRRVEFRVRQPGP